MQLFLNVLITENAITYYERYRLPRFPRIDVFKYALASYAVIPFSKVHLNVKLDYMYSDRWGELAEYCEKLWPDTDLHLVNDRFEWQKDWVDWVESLPDDETILCLANDDHVNLSFTNDFWIEADKIVKNCDNPLASMYVSHWPENIVNAYHPGCLNPNKQEARKVGNFMEVLWQNIDSVQLCTKALLHKWWNGKKHYNRILRTDCPTGERVQGCDTTCYIPLVELCRHFDGYSHSCGVDGGICPPLVIPEGFFDKDLKLTFYTNDKWPKYTSCNPISHFLAATHPNGADNNYSEWDYPLFWDSYISEEKYVGTVERDYVLGFRNERIMEMAYCHKPHSEKYGPPKEWIFQHEI